MTEILVFERNLTAYLVENFQVQVVAEDEQLAEIRIPAHFLTILPDDGWHAKNYC